MTAEQAGLSLAGHGPTGSGHSGVSQVLVVGCIDSPRQVMNQVHPGTPARSKWRWDQK